MIWWSRRRHSVQVCICSCQWLSWTLGSRHLRAQESLSPHCWLWTFSWTGSWPGNIHQCIIYSTEQISQKVALVFLYVNIHIKSLVYCLPLSCIPHGCVHDALSQILPISMASPSKVQYCNISHIKYINYIHSTANIIQEDLIDQVWYWHECWGGRTWVQTRHQGGWRR